MSTWEEFKREVVQIEGYVVAALTDKYIVDYWPDMRASSLDGKEDKLLEIRVFSEKEEWKLFRTDISKEFRMRYLSDEAAVDANGNKLDKMEASYYLDVDTDRSKGIFEKDGKVFTMAGGKYYLPVDNSSKNKMEDVKLKLVYYLDRYEATGQARVSDFRLVGIGKEE